MSASSRPTFWPAAASAAARLTVTDDLPTPPFPLATAYTLVSDEGLANGISRSALPPRSLPCSPRRCSSLITSSSTRTRDTPASTATAAVTSRVMVSRSGQPTTVSQTSTRTVPSAATSTCLTMPSSVIGRWISGSSTPERAWVTWSMVGGEATADAEGMTPCYEPLGTPSKAGGRRARCAAAAAPSARPRLPQIADHPLPQPPVSIQLPAFGRPRDTRAPASARCARYFSLPPCGVISRDATPAQRPIDLAISPCSTPLARPREISSLSANLSVLRRTPPVHSRVRQRLSRRQITCTNDPVHPVKHDCPFRPIASTGCDQAWQSTR